MGVRQGVHRDLARAPLPRIEGRAGAAFCIQWGWVSADSDGPVEWCKPVPQAEARALAERYPELTLRTEPAHREAFVALPAGYRPEDLGLRTTYLATGPVTDPVPDIDLALPFAVE